MRAIRTSGVYHPDREVVEGTVILVEDGRVVDVRDDVPNDATLVHDSDSYALPGLVDAHSHAPIRPGEGDQLGQMRANPVEQTVRAVENLRRDLEAGTTTMRLMGCEHGLDVHLATLERDGSLVSPRLLPTGGHLTPTAGHGMALTATDGPEAIRRRIREHVAAGAHHVKYFATGGVSSAEGSLDEAPYSTAEVEAIVDEAHRHGRHVATHAHGGTGARQAIDAGVDTIEHGAALSTDDLDALEAGESHVVGTFTILHSAEGIEAGDADSPAVMANLEAARERERETWTALLDRDVDVALGTDSMHGHLPGEVDHLLSRGASPERAIRAVTTEAARAARVVDAGHLSPGAHADVLLVADPPVDRPATLAEPRAVVKGGEVVA